MMNYSVCSAIELGHAGGNTKRCYETNATGLTEEVANDVAARRNKCEKTAGHHNVNWFVMKELPELKALRAMMAERYSKGVSAMK